jgi:hypothetical protein
MGILPLVQYIRYGIGIKTLPFLKIAWELGPATVTFDVLPDTFLLAAIVHERKKGVFI